MIRAVNDKGRPAKLGANALRRSTSAARIMHRDRLVSCNRNGNRGASDGDRVE